MSCWTTTVISTSFTRNLLQQSL